MARSGGSELAAQRGDRDAAGERADVGGRDDAAGGVADRRGGGAQAALELLVDDRVALAAHAVELVAQRRARWRRVAGVSARSSTRSR